MEQKIYILVASGGEYDDAWESNIAASFDQAKLEAQAAKLISEIEGQRQRRNELNQFSRAWILANPAPIIVDPTDMEFMPKWNGIQKITKEMRQERAEIETRNTAKVRTAYQPYDDWNSAHMVARCAWIVSKGYDPESLTDCSISDADDYRVEVVEFVS